MTVKTQRSSPNFGKLISEDAMLATSYGYSGELTATVDGLPLGVARSYGQVSNVFMSVAASGKDDSNALQIAGDVFINGVSCLSTKPVIAHVSGEASSQKTTAVTGDTGIIQAIVDGSANDVTPGDILTGSFTLTRTASPTTEISTPVIAVELIP